MRRVPACGTALVAALLAVPAAWATNEPPSRARPPWDYKGQVQLHDVSMDAKLPPPERKDFSSEFPPTDGLRSPLPADGLGGSTPALPSTMPPPRRLRDRNPADKWGGTTGDKGTQDQGKPSGWGWLADEVLKADARRPADGANKEDDVEGQEEQPVDRRSSSANRPDASPEADYGYGGTNAQEAGSSTRTDMRSQTMSDDRPAVEPVLGWSDKSDRWTVGDTMAHDPTSPDVQSSNTKPADLWNASGLADRPRDSFLAPAAPTFVMPGQDAIQAEDRDVAVRSRLSLPGPDAEAGRLGSSLSPSEEHATRFAMPSAATAPVGDSGGGWSGAGGSAFGAMQIQPVQVSVSPVLPSITATPSTPSLGGMGSASDKLLPKTLPW